MATYVSVVLLGLTPGSSLYPSSESSGALRDMVQNHLTQMLALTAMEPPGHFDPEAIRNEKAKVLQAAKLANEEKAWECCVRGQYSKGGGNEDPLLGYREEPGCLLYTSPSPRDGLLSRMPSSA